MCVPTRATRLNTTDNHLPAAASAAKRLHTLAAPSSSGQCSTARAGCKDKGSACRTWRCSCRRRHAVPPRLPTWIAQQRLPSGYWHLLRCQPKHCFAANLLGWRLLLLLLIGCRHAARLLVPGRRGDTRGGTYCCWCWWLGGQEEAVERAFRLQAAGPTCRITTYEQGNTQGIGGGRPGGAVRRRHKNQQNAAPIRYWGLFQACAPCGHQDQAVELC